MAGQRRQRPGAGGTGAGKAARRGGTGQTARGAGPAGRPGGRRAGRQGKAPDQPAGRGVLRALNPRKAPTRARVRLAALVFAALAVVLGVVGVTIDGGYLRPAALLAILAVLWGVRALTMR